eukprot:9820470-Karenia_brevis.AAC.1
MQWIWESYSKNTVVTNGQQCHINGNFTLLLQDDKITVTAKRILNGWIKRHRKGCWMSSTAEEDWPHPFRFSCCSWRCNFCNGDAEQTQFSFIVVFVSHTNQ